MNTRQLTVGIVGTGGVARMHADAIDHSPRFELAGAFSRDERKVRAFAEEKGGKVYKSYDSLLGDPSIDLVAVCTPGQFHFEMASEALDAGKHVIVEKPVAQTVKEIQTLQQKAAAAGRICMPCHNYIYSPALQQAKALISSGELGRISSFWMIYNMKHDPDIGFPGMAMRDLCVHHAYAVLYLLGRPERIFATSGNVRFTQPDADDQVMIVCKYAHGLIANLWGSFAADDHTSDPWTVVFKILGTDGSFTTSWNAAVGGTAFKPGWDKFAYRDSFRNVYAHFAERCLDDGEPALSSMLDASDALRIIEAAETSLATMTAIDWNARA